MCVPDQIRGASKRQASSPAIAAKARTSNRPSRTQALSIDWDEDLSWDLMDEDETTDVILALSDRTHESGPVSPTSYSTQRSETERNHPSSVGHRETRKRLEFLAEHHVRNVIEYRRILFGPDTSKWQAKPVSEIAASDIRVKSNMG